MWVCYNTDFGTLFRAMFISFPCGVIILCVPRAQYTLLPEVD